MTKGEKENVTPQKNRQNDFFCFFCFWFFDGYSQ